MIYNTISFRLSLWYSLVLFAALLAFGALIFWGISNEIYNDQTALLAEKAELLNEHMRIDDKRLDKDYIREHQSRLQFEENGIFFQIHNTKKTIMHSENTPPALKIKIPENPQLQSQKIKTPDGYTYQCLITPTVIKDKKKRTYIYYIITGRSTIYAQNILGRIRLYGMLLIPIMVIFAASGGWLLAKRAMKPVASLTSAAKSITLKNINKQLPAPANPHDELGQLTLTFNDMIERIRTGIDSIRRFTGDASHELRTPLTILRGEMEVALRKPRTNAEYQNTLSSALQEVSFMEKIINDLLTLARIDAGKTLLQLRQTDINSLMGQVIQIHKNAAEIKNIEITFTPGKNIIQQLLDPEKIRQVFSNILDNAIKYTPENGKIHISSHLSDQSIIYTIKDNGPGISQNDLPHIFDRFYRADKSRSREMHSSGLGLAICKWIIDAHQGNIKISSKKNIGTTVTLEFPVLKSEKSPALI